jgi:hypothetical protein
MLRNVLFSLLALMALSAPAFAVIDGTNSASQQQQVAVGQLQPGMGTATGNSVTVNNGSGIVTTAALSTAAGGTQAITIANSRIVAGDAVLATVDPNGSTGTPVVANVAVTAGQAVVTIQNIHASAALNAAVKVYFIVLKGGNAN